MEACVAREAFLGLYRKQCKKEPNWEVKPIGLYKLERALGSGITAAILELSHNTKKSVVALFTVELSLANLLCPVHVETPLTNNTTLAEDLVSIGPRMQAPRSLWFLLRFLCYSTFPTTSPQARAGCNIACS